MLNIVDKDISQICRTHMKYPYKNNSQDLQRVVTHSPVLVIIVKKWKSIEMLDIGIVLKVVNAFNQVIKYGREDHHWLLRSHDHLSSRYHFYYH